MNIIKTIELARALYRAHGDMAEFDAAQRKRRSLEAGEKTEAAHWGLIQQQISQLRGAHQS